MSLEEIRQMEEMGIKVMMTDGQGRMLYATESGDGEKYCDRCECLRFMPAPDPYDRFHDGDQKANCTEMRAMVAGALESHERTHILKPLWCPRLGRMLTEEEKEEANQSLELGKKRYS